MISLSTSEPVPWAVPWNDKQRFLFKAGSVIDRANFEAELAGEFRAARVFAFEKEAALIGGVEALLKDNPDQAAHLKGWIEAEAAEEPLSAEEAAEYEQAKAVIAEHWPPYGALIERDERRRQIIPMAAFRRFCVGWEGDGLPDFSVGFDRRVSLELMKELAPLSIQAGGIFAYNLLYGTDAEKKSKPPSSSVKGPVTSGSSTRVGGKSTAKSGRKTQSSRSRNGASQSSTSGSTAGA